MSHAVMFELRTTCPAADAGLMMPLTRNVMISTRSPRFLHMIYSTDGPVYNAETRAGATALIDAGGVLGSLEADGFPD